MSQWCGVTISAFLLTPLREGRRTRTALPLLTLTNFYSRPCGRGDVHQYPDYAMADEFLLTPLREGRPTEAIIKIAETLFLLTPLREGRPQHDQHETRVERISTHAPAGGATNLDFSISQKINFYSRPCGRGDQCKISEFRWNLHFYSRPCGRGDPTHSHKTKMLCISTHAPAGGATRRPGAFASRRQSFLLTPLREGRREERRNND